MEGANSALETPQFEMEMAKIEMDYVDADETTLCDLTIDKIDTPKIENNLVWLWALIIRTPFTGFSIFRNKDS